MIIIKRYIFLIFLSAALSTTVLAYEPMLVDGKQWNYYCESARGPNSGYYFHYVLRGEQEMGGHQCKVLYRSMRDGQERACAYLYEEGMRVYYVNVKTGESLLLYDFSLQKGDITNDPFYGDSFIVEDVFEMNGGKVLTEGLSPCECGYMNGNKVRVRCHVCIEKVKN